MECACEEPTVAVIFGSRPLSCSLLAVVKSPLCSFRDRFARFHTMDGRRWTDSSGVMTCHHTDRHWHTIGFLQRLALMGCITICTVFGIAGFSNYKHSCARPGIYRYRYIYARVCVDGDGGRGGGECGERMGHSRSRGPSGMTWNTGSTPCEPESSLGHTGGTS